jgi:SAM-dependent methyltransferase
MTFSATEENESMSDKAALSISRAAQRVRQIFQRIAAAHRDTGVAGVVQYLQRSITWPFANLLRFASEYSTDREFGIHTRTSVIFPKDDGSEQHPYQPVTKAHFNLAMSLLPVEPNELTFIDLGCGKGTALFLAAKRGFVRVIGVEIVQELLDQALANCRHLLDRNHLLSDRIDVILGDAANYDFPRGPKMLFLFNPFGEETLHQVLAHFVVSVQMDTAPSYLLYRNPILHDIVLSYPHVDEIARTSGTTAYRVQASATGRIPESNSRAG